MLPLHAILRRTSRRYQTYGPVKWEYQRLTRGSGCSVWAHGPGVAVAVFNKRLPESEPGGGSYLEPTLLPPGNPGNATGNGGGSNGSLKTAQVIFGDIYLVFFAPISFSSCISSGTLVDLVA